MSRLTAALGLAAILAVAAPASADDGAFRAGLALPMHSDDPSFDYRPLVREIAALGARDLSILVHLYQENARSPRPERHLYRTPRDATLEAAIKEARRLGMRVMLMPIVLLSKPAEEDWRGSLNPPDWKAWKAAYLAEMLRFARIAERAGADLLSVGSELSSLEGFLSDWYDIIKQLRGAFTGKLTYSANWDHFDRVGFWDELDYMGISSYYELSESTEPTREELEASWRKVQARLVKWRALNHVEAKLLFTEVGYASQDGCASAPWDYFLSETVDLEEQKLCYEAFLAVWDGHEALGGVFVYEWWGLGGERDTRYTPKGKPAQAVLEAWFAKHPRPAAAPPK